MVSIGDRGLAGLPVAEDQFALAAADRDERVDDLQAGLQRHRHRRTVHDRRRRPLDRQAPFAVDRGQAVERPAERVDDAPQQARADGDVHHAALAPDLGAGMQQGVVAEQHDADLGLVDVEGQAQQAAREADHFGVADARQSADMGHAGGDGEHRPDFARHECRRAGPARKGHRGEDVVEALLQGFESGRHGGHGLRRRPRLRPARRRGPPVLARPLRRQVRRPLPARALPRRKRCRGLARRRLQQVAHPTIERSEIVVDGPGELLALRDELDACHQGGLGVVAQVELDAEGIGDGVVDGATLCGRQLEGTAHQDCLPGPARAPPRARPWAGLRGLAGGR